MTEARVYSKAPIVEAVIDISVRWRDGAAVDFSACANALSSQFPQKNAIHQMTMNVSMVGTEASSSKKEEVGYRLVNANKDRILQLQRSGFTLSHMPPYTQWSVFRGEAEPLWTQFVRLCSPERITRIGVRYLNRLKLPLGTIELEDYLVVAPRFPDLGEPISGFFVQVQMAQPKVAEKCMSVITVASEPQTDPRHQAIALDLNVSVDVDLEPTDGHLWTVLEQLRHGKNRLFEAAVTEQFKETFV